MVIIATITRIIMKCKISVMSITLLVWFLGLSDTPIFRIKNSGPVIIRRLLLLFVDFATFTTLLSLGFHHICFYMPAGLISSQNDSFLVF